MNPERVPPETNERQPSVEVEPLGSGSRFSTIIRLHGGHDVATSRRLREAFRSVDGDVLLDLSTCEFIDSSVIFVIYADCNARARSA